MAQRLPGRRLMRACQVKYALDKVRRRHFILTSVNISNIWPKEADIKHRGAPRAEPLDAASRPMICSPKRGARHFNNGRACHAAAYMMTFRFSMQDAHFQALYIPSPGRMIDFPIARRLFDARKAIRSFHRPATTRMVRCCRQVTICIHNVDILLKETDISPGACRGMA